MNRIMQAAVYLLLIVAGYYGVQSYMNSDNGKIPSSDSSAAQESTAKAIPSTGTGKQADVPVPNSND